MGEKYIRLFYFSIAKFVRTVSYEHRETESPNHLQNYMSLVKSFQGDFQWRKIGPDFVSQPHRWGKLSTLPHAF